MADDPTKRRRTLIIGVLALLLVVVLVLVLVTALNQRRNSATADAVTGSVRGYLSAIADGNSQQALGYLASKPDNADLLTDDVLAASNKIAPMTGINVPEVTDGARTVQAWYKIGSQRYQQQFTVQPAGDSFVIDGGTATVDLSGLTKGLSYRLNGVSVESGSASIFPGSYRVTSTSPYLSLGSSAGFVAQPRDRLTLSIDPKLNEGGAKAVRKAISSSVNGCLAAKTLKAGCGLSISDDGPGRSTVRDQSVSRDLSAEAEQQLGKIRLFVDPQDPSVVRSEGVRGAVKTEATCEREKKGKKGKKKTKTKDCTITGSGTSLATPTAKLDGDDVSVSWH